MPSSLRVATPSPSSTQTHSALMTGVTGRPRRASSRSYRVGIFSTVAPFGIFVTIAGVRRQFTDTPAQAKVTGMERFLDGAAGVTLWLANLRGGMLEVRGLSGSK